MSGSIEINVESDEWLDITTKEEILRNEVEQLKAALTASNQLVEELEGHKKASNQLVEELEDQKKFLEVEREMIRNEFNQSNEKLASVETKLKETLADKAAVEKTHKHELVMSREGILGLECEIKDIKRNHDKESKEARSTINRLTKVVDDLQNKLSAADKTCKNQKEQISKTQADLLECRDQLTAVKKQHMWQMKASDESSKKLELASKQLGAVAVLAEDRKDERVALKRTVAQQKHMLDLAGKDLENCYKQISSLKTEMAHMKTVFEVQIKDLEDSLNAHQKELCEARDEIKNQACSLEAKSESIKDAHQQIQDLQAILATVKNDASSLQSELDESRANEEALQNKLEQQKLKHDRQLNTVREALSLPTFNLSLPSKFSLPSSLKFA
jgi:chromosome segregation ATPase